MRPDDCDAIVRVHSKDSVIVQEQDFVIYLSRYLDQETAK